jgi:hypothetical protein
VEVREVVGCMGGRVVHMGGSSVVVVAMWEVVWCMGGRVVHGWSLGGRGGDVGGRGSAGAIVVRGTECAVMEVR